MTRLSLVLQAGATLLLLSPSTYASFITNSNLSINSVGAVAVNENDIDFGYTGGATVTEPPIATDPVAATGFGNFTVNAGSTNGSFAGLTSVVVQDLCRGGAGCPALGEVQAGTPTDFANFITFPQQPTWSIALTLLELGTDGTAGCAGAPGSGTPGQVCSIPNSPFDLQNTSTGVTVSFAFLGSLTNGTSTNPIQGNFSTTFSGTDLQTILSAINQGESIATGATGSLTIQSAAPEPSTILLAGLGGALLALGAIRRRARN